jgi:hypothetical protein
MDNTCFQLFLSVFPVSLTLQTESKQWKSSRSPSIGILKLPYAASRLPRVLYSRWYRICISSPPVRYSRVSSPGQRGFTHSLSTTQTFGIFSHCKVYLQGVSDSILLLIFQALSGQRPMQSISRLKCEAPLFCSLRPAPAAAQRHPVDRQGTGTAREVCTVILKCLQSLHARSYFQNS